METTDLKTANRKRVQSRKDFVDAIRDGDWHKMNKALWDVQMWERVIDASDEERPKNWAWMQRYN